MAIVTLFYILQKYYHNNCCIFFRICYHTWEIRFTKDVTSELNTNPVPAPVD